ncbi:MAG TPA: hypothetical protein VFQ45_07925 [Longimicrobium sp.]|nr:hypothetical protein [Longimicrobium sp.]
MPRIALRPTALAAVCAVLGLAACRDESPVQPGPRLAAPAFPAGINQPVDNAIDPSDTWVTYDATREHITYVSLAEPVVDAATVQPASEITLAQPAEVLHTEAGYDAYGTVRVNEYHQQPAQDPYEQPVDETRQIQVVGDQVTGHGYDGEVTVAAQESDVAEAPLGELGSLAGAQVTAGMIVDRQDVEYVSTNRVSAQRLGIPDVPGATTRVERMAGGRVLITTRSAETLPAHAPGPPESAGRQETRVSRRYAPRRDKYVLEQLEVETRAETARGRMTVRQTTQLRNVTWSVNARKDAERRVLRERAQAAGAPARSLDGDLPVDNCPVDAPDCTASDPNDPPPDGGGGTPPPPSYDSCEGADPAGRDVVFQHGIYSSAATWGRMIPWMRSDFYLGCTLAPSLDSNARLEHQAGALKNRLWQTGRLGWVLIGHSQGGLISRHVAQRVGGYVHGVVTVGTPHHGAPITKASNTAVFGSMTAVTALAASGCSVRSSFGCPKLAQFASGITVLASYGFSLTQPVFEDLKPGSAFQQELNSQPEGFLRVGIQHFPKKLWVEWRLLGDNLYGPDPQYGGPKWVKGANAAFLTNTACGVVGWLIGFTGTAARCATRAAGMLATDLLWNFMTARWGKTDGIVPGSSQIYPNATENLSIPNGDSHVGETRSTHTRTRLRTALDEYMEVTPRQVW